MMVRQYGLARGFAELLSCSMALDSLDDPEAAYAAYRERERRPREIQPGVILLPPRFKCPECGCEESVKRFGFEECAWCQGNGKRLA